MRGPAIATIVLAACHAAPPPILSAPAEPTRPAPTCAATDPAGIAACVDRERMLADVRTIAGARPPGSVHHAEVATHCDAVLDALGFTVVRERFASGTNIVGTLAGATDERVVVGAHYDSVVGCEAADDNASGVAGVLELARVLSGKSWRRTLVVACWDDEENGLVGSRAHVAALGDAPPLAVAFNFDGIGVARREPGSQAVPTGFGVLFPDEVAQLHAREDRGDFIAVVADDAATVYARRLAEHADTLALPTAVLSLSRVWITLPVAIDLRRSDHASFWAAGVPAVMITDTADFRSAGYHCRGGADAITGLDPGFMRDVVAASAYAIVHALTASQQ